MQNKVNPKKNISSILKILHETWPNAHCELEHYNHFQLLIAVMLSAQTTDKSVNKALNPILQKNKNFSVSHLIEMGEEQFYQAIRSIGLAPTKAKNCYKTALILRDKYKEKVPLERNALESLPGVGRKTASVVLNVLCQLPTMPVDTHVERVTKRLGLVSLSANTLKVEKELLEIMPTEYGVKAHHLFIFHGRYHCLARSPKCSTCPLTEKCPKKL